MIFCRFLLGSSKLFLVDDRRSTPSSLDTDAEHTGEILRFIIKQSFNQSGHEVLPGTISDPNSHGVTRC